MSAGEMLSDEGMVRALTENVGDSRLVVGSRTKVVSSAVSFGLKETSSVYPSL